MSNRFHNKFHRQNHHSAATPGYPDSAMDPIASFEQPFKGEFYSQGDIITTENLSANKYVYADDGLFHKDLTVKGNFTVLGTTSQIDTLVYTTSAVNISNVGTGPALKVTQSGSQPIAHFIDSNGDDIIFADNGFVGLGVASPSEKLTIAGNLSSSGTATIGTIATGAVNSVLLQNAGLVQKRDINPQVWDTTAKFVSASDGALTVNRLTKAENSNGIDESIVFDDGTNVGIGTDTPGSKLTIAGNLSSSGTATVGTIATNSTGNSFVVETAGLLQKRSLNIGALDTTATFVSASDGALTVNRLTKAENSNGIDESIVFDDGTNVGIGTDTPGAKLTVSGTLSTAGTATIGTIDTGTGTSILIESNGLIQKRTFSDLVGGSSGVTGTGTANKITKWSDSDTVADSIVTDNGSLVSIAGNLSSSGTATIGTLATGTSDTVIIESSGTLQKRTIDSRAWGSSLVDGTGTANRVAYWTDSNTIAADADLFFDGTNVGIGTITPSEKLTVAGNLSASGTATIGTLATNSTGNSFIVETNGLLQKRSLNTGALNTTATFVSASDGALTVNRLTKAENSNGIDESIVFDNGTNVGIGTDTPGAKLTVSGTLSTSGTATIGTLATNSAGTSFVVETAGLLQKRSLNVGSLDTTAVFVSASDGALTVNRLTKATNSNGINESIVTDDGIIVSISGNLSSSGTATIGTLATGTVNSVLVESSGLLQKRTIDARAWGSSLVDGTGTTNYITKWSDADTITNSIVTDNGSLVSIAGNLSSSGTATIGTLATGTGSSFVIESNGLLQKRGLNTAALDTTSKFVSASDGALIVNRLPKATNSNGINESIVYDDGTNVGIGTDTPGAKLTVNGTLSTSSTVNVGGIGTGTDNSVVILDTNGFLRTDEIDSRVWGSSLVDGTGTANRVAYWTDSNTISADSDFFFDGTNVGIGTTTPGTGVKLDVNGVIRSVANTVTPAATTALPSSNDVILNNQTGPITITAFSGGVAGVTYTITNKSTHAVTLDTSASLFVRGGNSWASHKCTTNAEGYIVLPQNFSCSLRMDSSTSGSAW